MRWLYSALIAASFPAGWLLNHFVRSKYGIAGVMWLNVALLVLLFTLLKWWTAAILIGATAAYFAIFIPLAMWLGRAIKRLTDQ